MRHPFALLVLCAAALGQNLPDAPDPQPKPSIWHQRLDPSTYRSNREVLRSKTFWAYFGTDVAVDVFDAEMSHAGLAHHRCIENHALNSRWQLYRNNLPEEAAVFAVGFMGTKIRMPRWLMFGTIVYPVEVHLRAGTQWYADCW